MAAPCIPPTCPVAEIREMLCAHQEAIDALRSVLVRHMEREEGEFALLVRSVAEVLDHVRGHV